MSSIRSLATITLLAGVGVFLYMKINEPEPVIPAEVGDFEIGSLEFDQPVTTSSNVPQFGTTPANSSAPAFDSAPQFGAALPGDQAPAWNDSQVSNAPPPARHSLTN